MFVDAFIVKSVCLTPLPRSLTSHRSEINKFKDLHHETHVDAARARRRVIMSFSACLSSRLSALEGGRKISGGVRTSLKARRGAFTIN